MTIRTLLVALTGSATDALAAGFALAKQFGAHLDAVYLRVDPAAEFRGLRLQEGWRALVDEMAAMRALEAEAKRGARAVAGALPFLERADAVHVITPETEAIAAAEGQRLAGYLARHGIATAVVSLSSADRGVGPAILGKAKELGADLLVMGGYGHSRVREVILGGVTRHVLEQAELPVLIAH